MRAKSNATERAKDPTLLVIYQSKEATAQLRKLFDLMDKDGNGSLEAVRCSGLSCSLLSLLFCSPLDMQHMMHTRFAAHDAHIEADVVQLIMHT